MRCKTLVSRTHGSASAYQANDIRQFEKILKANKQSIMGDPFVREYIQGDRSCRIRPSLSASPSAHGVALDLLKNIRTQVLIKLIKPYTCVRIPYISKELNIPENEVESLLVSCILDR